MPIHVQAPNGEVVEFPDGTSDDVMAGAMKQAYGGGQAAAPASNAPDLTSQFNTALSPADEHHFQAWTAKTGKGGDLADYDLRGAWQSAVSPAANGHLPDTFKKPNHPTFSTDSQYSNDQTPGGAWQQDSTGQWSFAPSDFNVQTYGKDALQNYFKQNEPDSSLVMPQPPSTFMDVAKSAGSGLARGTADLVGLPGTLGDMFNNGMSYITGLPKLPASPFSGNTLRNAASTVSGGATDYKAQTVPGQFASTISEFVPGAIATGGENVIGSALKYAVVPGAVSEAAGQATKGTSAEPYARFVGALLAPAGASAMERLVTPLPISAERAAQNAVLHNEGVQLTAGQTTGRNSLKNVESELGGGAAGNFMEHQGEQFTQAALSRAGINAPRATPEVMDQGFTDIGNQFNGLAQRNNLVPDPQLGRDLGAAVRHYNSITPPTMRAPAVNNILADLVVRARQGPIPGDFYQNTTSQLAALGRSTADAAQQNAYHAIRHSLDDAMERSITANNPADLGGWQGARRNYRNMLVLEKAAGGAGENAAMGLISPSALRNAAKSQSLRAYVRGQGDFAELARAGEAVMKPLPNSGTAGRLSARNLFQGIPALLGSGAGGAVAGIPGAMAGAIAGAAVPAIAGRALLSRPARAYLSNQLIQPSNLVDPRYASVLAQLASQSQSGQLKTTK